MAGPLWNMGAYRADAQAGWPGSAPPPEPELEVSDMLVIFQVSDAANPDVVYVTNGVWYRRIANSAALAQLQGFMAECNMDNRVRVVPKAKVDFAGVLTATEGVGNANPWL